MKTSEAELEAILYEALESPIGLLLASNDPERARARLYAVRKKLGDGALGALQIRLTKDFPEEGSILIVKGKSE